MREQVISEYYINLEYNRSSKEEALIKISTLCKEIQLKNFDNFTKRFIKAVSIIEENLFLFKSACEHVDTVTTILEYLSNFSAKLMLGNNEFDLDKEYNKEELILSVVLTIFNICREPKVQLFLENVIIANSTLFKIQYNRLKNELSNQTNEMILLEDSDLYAVISYLRIAGHSRINKIWVQTPIKQRFLSLIKKYFRPKNLPICTWISTKDFTPRTSYNMNIISIWSEDIGRAKYLATLLDRDVVFINMHMDLYGGVILLPWMKIFDKLHERFEPISFSDSIQPSINKVNLSNIPPDVNFMSIYNLFYGGKWHKPVKCTYWKRNNILWASATSDDVRMCLNSAIEGLKTWKTFPLDTRVSIILGLLEMLKYYSKSLKDANELMTCLQFNDTSLLYSQNDKLEVIQNRIPRGVIILKEKTEEILFVRLMQILISGNSVIVLTDANSCSLAPYCDIFSLSKVPRGVINVLSNENTSDLELSLCATDYANYEKQFFTSSLEKTYINLTLPKQIVLSLKYNDFIDDIDIEHRRLICNQDRDT